MVSSFLNGHWICTLVIVGDNIIIVIINTTIIIKLVMLRKQGPIWVASVGTINVKSASKSLLQPHYLGRRDCQQEIVFPIIFMVTMLKTSLSPCLQVFCNMFGRIKIITIIIIILVLQPHYLGQ